MKPRAGIQRMTGFMGKLRRRGVRLFIDICQLARKVFYRVASTNTYMGRPLLHQPLQCVGRGRIAFADNVNIGVFPSPYFLSTYVYLESRNDSASIEIGSGTWINNNFCAIAEFSSITIGKNCLIGASVEILDSDFHGLRIADRRMSKPEWARPVVISDDVFIGSNVKIMKGVTVGRGSVIANGSVVVNDIPAGVICWWRACKNVWRRALT